MAPATSISNNKPRLSVINDNCALRRNVAVQPYGRCTVCTLQLHQCLAWQSSAMSFVLVIVILVPLFAPEAWAVRASIAGALALLIVQGVVNHKRTDELIHGQHVLARTSRALRETNVRLEQAREGLEGEVAARTQSLRESNVALARANLELAELVERRQRMVLEVSHDLRTPLTSIKGAAQNLIDGIAGALSTGQREYLEIVRDHSNRLIASIGKLLEAARETEVHVDLEAASIDVAALAADVAGSLAPIAEQRRVRLDAAAGAPVRAIADASKLRKVLENLIGNALKFTEAGGCVRVDAAAGDDEVRISVADTGVGLAPEAALRVFDRFWRGRDDRPGSGLGLAITRDLARLHGGDVLVKSAPGRGSTFVVVLPGKAA